MWIGFEIRLKTVDIIFKSMLCGYQMYDHTFCVEAFCERYTNLRCKHCETAVKKQNRTKKKETWLEIRPGSNLGVVVQCFTIKLLYFMLYCNTAITANNLQLPC